MSKYHQMPVEMQVVQDPNKCVVCGIGFVSSQKVHLIEKSGKSVIVCYVARCMHCGAVKQYGIVPGIFKMPLVKPDTNVAKWPEILRNDIDSDKFIYAILNAPNRPIWLNARDLCYKTQERPAFYEPAYAGRV